MRILFLLLAIMLGASYPAAAADHKTLFQGLRALDFSAADAASVNSIIRSKIDGIKNCDLVSERAAAAAMKKAGLAAPCADRACALQAARSQKASRVIYGTVSRTTRKYDARLAKEGAGKYLLTGKESDRYTFSLYLVDVEKGAVLAAVSETAPIDAVRPAAERIAARLAPFFRVATKEEARTSSSYGTAGKARRWYLHGSPSASVPVGVFRSMARAGAGFILGGGAENLVVPGLLAGIQIGYWYMFPSDKTVRSHHAVSLSALAGYRFCLPEGFSLAPVLGLGYFINILSHDSGEFHMPGLYHYTAARYYDPHVFLRLEASYLISDHWAILVSPGYFVFFEKGNTGMMATLDAGARYYF
ncbi:MAG: hypothetical protein JXA07_07315 [Spirochaetes bacterium]|nr:hypothetical protein [Spirochaetota bacterium]